MPRLYSGSVEFVNNDLEITVWTNKHVVGAIEDDLFLILDHQLDILRTGASGVGANREPRVSGPLVAVGKPEHIDIAQ